MAVEVMIDMKNSNALIAMAQVSQNANNPYAAFIEYIKYCIFTNPSRVMTVKEVREGLVEEFGLNMPNNILIKCLANIQEEGLISLDKHQIYVLGEFDTDAFEKKRMQFKEIEDTLIDELIRFVKKYDKVWDKSYARERLIKVLDANDLAYDIFINQGKKEGLSEVSENEIIECENDEEPLFSDDFYVGQFIDTILAEDSIYKDYLQKVCEGLMICIGVYQLPSVDSVSITGEIKDTAFYFDTRLLLRFVGCASEAAVQAAKELVSLVQNSGGKIYYFPHTLEEMSNALEDAAKSLLKGDVPHDEEMRIYASSINNKQPIISAKKANLEKELASAKIYCRPLGSYDEKDRIRFGFDKSDLIQYMMSQLKWDLKVIENDAASIWETHMLRKGVYSEYCGTKGRLPVFVTTNAALINVALGYRNDRKSVTTIAGWKTNRIPIITDIRLTCRLWSPSIQGERLSLLYLSANAVAAQKPTQRYINCIRELVEELQSQVPEYSNIALPAFFDDNVTDAVLEKTKGESTGLNIGMFASTMAELTEWKAKEQEDITNQVAEQLEQTTTTLNNQTKSIIDGAIEQNVNSMGIAGVILKLILWWPVIMTVLFTAVSAIVSKIIDKWSLLLIGIIPMVIYVIQMILSSKFVEKMMLCKIYPWAERKYEKKIIKALRSSEIPYKNEIILGCKENTELLKKCRNIM